MNTTLYVGPVATALDGVDLAWVVGLLVPGLSYYWLMKLGKRTLVTESA
jgi:NCS1 family nucleobase:cation symporter-1